MSRSLSSDDASARPDGGPASANDELQALRQLLFAEEKKQLNVLAEHIENPLLHAQDVSEVLPQAVHLAASRDRQLAVALTPAVESALRDSVRRNPSVLVEAVFPVIGPAIRKSIGETLKALLQSLNQALEHSLSLQGLRWRWEAARSGRSFGEVVLAHTLLYRVEQVFLIHKPTGLLLHHLRASGVEAEDATLVSAMLNAIQAFAQDSFRTTQDQGLHTLEVGDLYVWVESSPLVTLAAVIRGQAPYEYRIVIQGALESIHGALGPALQSFDGDAGPFELARPHLEPCLQAQYAESRTRRSLSWLRLLGVAGAVLLIAWLAWFVREQRRWARYLGRIKTEPGIVVTESTSHWGRHFITGLRDPLAADPAQWLSEYHCQTGKVVMRWEPYQALNPELVLKRAVMVLQPPRTVTLRVEDGVLAAEGVALPAWIDNLRRRAVLLPGIHELNDHRLTDQAQGAMAPSQQIVDQMRLQFTDGVRLAPGEENKLETLVALFTELRREAIRTRRAVQVAVVGHTDRVGAEQFNLDLSRQRADYVRNFLLARGLPPGSVTALGVAAREPAQPGLTEQDEVQNRRVTFRVLWQEPHSELSP